ncbi:hypothetical protein OBBRIDRAFT_770404 [Obba rivulosa]|uniref:PX domain-containing protein n=1 Tax=Obba rivulosa TaxID=1052685 RepID=A0A8E2DQT3_9APHY|nr:hypothetical protein OBBRIDRAFT_770404 [Obba rivulosa]
MPSPPSVRPACPTREVPQPPRHPDSCPSSPESDAQVFATPRSSHSPPSSSPISAATPEDTPSNEAQPDVTLTAIRAHYLKKQLITLEFQRELDALISCPANNISPLSYIGAPFTPLPKDAPPLELPFIRFFFRKFVLSFPFLAAAPRDFFPEKLQPFITSILSRNFSQTSVLDDDPQNSEEVARHRLLAKIERNLGMLLTSATKLIEKEDVVRLTQRDLDRLELVARKRAAREKHSKDRFEVNVVCVRTVNEKGRVRSRVHEEFIIRTRRSGQRDIFVSRRYGDFKTLAATLRKEHSDETIPPLPQKDRSFVNLNVSATSASLSSPMASPTYATSNPYVPSPLSSSSSSTGYANSQSVQNVTPNYAQHGRAHSKSSRHAGMPGMYDVDRNSSNGSIDSFNTPPMSPAASHTSGGLSQQASRLAREKNRLTLRSYLHRLLASSTLASSPVLRSFLLSGPTRLSEEEQEDARRREEADRLREDGRKRFAREIAARVDGLREAVRSVKGDLFAKDGLTHIFATIKQTPAIRDLPPNYKAVIEWARISLASTVFQNFVAADNASEAFANLKRIHGLMPYFMLKTVLKISNPVGMIRGVLDLFLAQPFGGRSLLQRMFTGSLMEEVKALEEDIEAVKDKVADPLLCEKLRLFVYAPPEIQVVYKEDAAAENIHVLVAVLRSGEQPTLSRAQMQRVLYAHRAYKEYVKYTESLSDSDDDEGPPDEEAWLFEDLSILAKLYARLRDRQQLIELIFEGNTADLLKDVITIFYAPLAQVYRAASISESLGDLQNFINDLVRTVEQSEELSQSDPARTVQIFIDLIQRHEQAFYSFVHKVHSKGEGLFTNLMQWIELFLTLMREGLGQPVSLEFLLPHTGQERADIMREVDEIALYHYKLKIAYEAKVRKRFGRTQGMNDADAEDEMTAQLVSGVVRDISFGELVEGNADDLAAEEDEDEDSSSEEETSGSGSGSDISHDSDDSESDESDDDSGNDGGSTERATTPHGAISHVVREHTIGHSARSGRAPNEQSLDIPSKRPPLPPLRTSRSMAFPEASSSSTGRPSPTSAQAKRPQERRSTPPSPRKRNANAPKPPELKHIPQLLPLFIEIMRPSLRTQ